MIRSKYEIHHLARGTLISHSPPPALPVRAHDAIHQLYHGYYMNVCAILIWTFHALLLVCCAQSKIWYAYFTFKFTSPSPASLMRPRSACSCATLSWCHCLFCLDFWRRTGLFWSTCAQHPKTRVTHIPVPRPRWLLTRLRPY